MGEQSAHEQYDLGVKYREGQGVTQDYTEAVRWFRLAAHQGYADAQRDLGLMYRSAQGVWQDYKESERWLRMAADQGDQNTRCILGDVLLAQGDWDGYAQAQKEFRQAAEQGYAEAQFKLGLTYRDGFRYEGRSDVDPTGQKYGEAARWFRLAAEQGHIIAQYNLGCLYRDGLGVPQDYVQAYMWLILTGTDGDSIADKIKPQDIADAHRLLVASGKLTPERVQKIVDRLASLAREERRVGNKVVLVTPLIIGIAVAVVMVWSHEGPWNQADLRIGLGVGSGLVALAALIFLGQRVAGYINRSPSLQFITAFLQKSIVFAFEVAILVYLFYLYHLFKSL